MRRDIPDAELQWRFSPTGGPGGQHANKTATRVELVFDVAESRLFDDQIKARIVGRLGATVRIIEDGSRSQATNRKRALRRLNALLEAAAQPDPPPRRPTRPTRAARRKRAEAKAQRSRTKALRRKPDPND